MYSLENKSIPANVEPIPLSKIGRGRTVLSGRWSQILTSQCHTSVSNVRDNAKEEQKKTS
jgi:hypothetical protein